MDPISDMLTSIRNALAVGKETVDISFSNFKFEILKILEKKGFINLATKKRKNKKRVIEIILKYKDGNAVISGLKKISKPGQRIYKGWREIKPVKNGYGIAIISTSQGLMTDIEAKKKKLGGEVICEIW